MKRYLRIVAIGFGCIVGMFGILYLWPLPKTFGPKARMQTGSDALERRDPPALPDFSHMAVNQGGLSGQMVARTRRWVGYARCGADFSEKQEWWRRGSPRTTHRDLPSE